MAVLALALAAPACSQPGTQVSTTQAAELDVATSRISVACGYAEELGAQGPPSAAARGRVESIAASGAAKLASVYARDETDIYQGESVGAIVHDSISLLGDCDLPGARRMLERALGQRR